MASKNQLLGSGIIQVDEPAFGPYPFWLHHVTLPSRMCRNKDEELRLKDMGYRDKEYTYPASSSKIDDSGKE